jgi:hypothetical protein
MDRKHASRARPRQRVMLGSVHCFVFILSVAATITRCTDSAATGAAGARTSGVRVEVLCRQSPSLPECHGTASLDSAMCGLSCPLFLSAALRAGSRLRCASMRGGAPDGAGPWSERTRGRDRYGAYPPGASAGDPWALGDRAPAAGSYAEYQDTDTGMQPRSDSASYGQPAEWLHELLDEEPSVAQVAGALAGRGVGERGLFFPNPAAFAAAVKTVAFLVGSAARAPREMAWRKVRRSNPALRQRLGEQGYRLLQNCGYMMVRHTSRENEAFYVLRGMSPRTLEAMERLLLGAADHGQAWMSREYSMWLEGVRHPATDKWNVGRMGFGEGAARRRDAHAHAGPHYPSGQVRARSDAMPSSPAIYDGGKGSSGAWSAAHGVAGGHLGYGRAIVQQRSAALLRARQSLLLALEAEASARNRTMAAPAQEEVLARDGRTRGTFQRNVDAGDDGPLQQLLEVTHRALTCTSSAAERMLRSRTLAAKRGGGIERGSDGGVGGGVLSMVQEAVTRELDMIQHVLGASREQLREVAVCQQRMTAAAHGLRREVSRQAEARRVCSEAQRLVQLNSQREDSALLRCQELQVVS